MKNLGIILLLLVVSLVSCSKDEDTNHPLVGTWADTYTEDEIVYTDEITFKSNNSGILIYKEDGVLADEDSFSWSTNNNILTVTISSSGDTESIVYSISGNILSLGGDEYIRK